MGLVHASFDLTMLSDESPLTVSDELPPVPSPAPAQRAQPTVISGGEPRSAPALGGIATLTDRDLLGQLSLQFASRSRLCAGAHAPHVRLGLERGLHGAD